MSSQLISLDKLISNLDSGSRPKGGVGDLKEGVPSLGAEHLDSQGGFNFKKIKYISMSFYEAQKKGKIQLNDILIVKDVATTGKTSFIDETFPFNLASINEHVFRLSVDFKIAHPKYIFYFLASVDGQRQVLSDFRGATVGGISRKFAEIVKVPFLPIEEQQQVAAILDAADNLRKKDEQLIEHYTTLSQSLFLDMFGDPVTNPMEWDKVEFGTIGSLDRGKSKHRPRNAPELLGGTHPLIQTGDVANCGGYITRYSSTYSDFGLRQSKMWNAGTLCITIAANIAKTGILTFDACFPDSVVGFMNNEKSNIKYVRSWMSFLQKIIEDAAPMAAQKNINLKILRELEIPLPPIILQNQFAERIAIIEQQKQQAQASLEKSEALFDSLLQRAFNGELTAKKLQVA